MNSLRSKIRKCVEEVGDPLMRHIQKHASEWDKEEVRQEVLSMVNSGELRTKEDEIAHDWSYRKGPKWDEEETYHIEKEQIRVAQTVAQNAQIRADSAESDLNQAVRMIAVLRDALGRWVDPPKDEDGKILPFGLNQFEDDYNFAKEVYDNTQKASHDHNKQILVNGLKGAIACCEDVASRWDGAVYSQEKRDALYGIRECIDAIKEVIIENDVSRGV